MTIDKAIYDKRNTAKKIKFLTELQRRFEDAKSKGFEGDIDDFKENILRKRYKDILIKSRGGLTKGGPVKPNGQTTLSTDQWLELLDPGGWASEEDKPMKVSYKFGTTSQSEEDLISGEIDNWKNLIGKGELDPSTSFMQYLDMILGRSGGNRGGIVSVI